MNKSDIDFVNNQIDQLIVMSIDHLPIWGWSARNYRLRYSDLRRGARNKRMRGEYVDHLRNYLKQLNIPIIEFHGQILVSIDLMKCALNPDQARRLTNLTPNKTET